MGELRGLSETRSGGALCVCGHCELPKLVRCYYLKEAVCNTVLYREREVAAGCTLAEMC
jgi:hypothetical protein